MTTPVQRENSQVFTETDLCVRGVFFVEKGKELFAITEMAAKMWIFVTEG